MGNRIFALVIKEFLALLQDPKSRMVIIVPPIIQLLVFGYAATFDLNDIPYAVYNEDPGQASRDVLARFRGSPHFHQVATIHRQEQLTPLIDNQKALLVLHFDQRFSRRLESGMSADLQVILDGRNSNTALIAFGYVQSITNQFMEAWRIEHGQTAPPGHLVTRAWFNPNLESRWFIVPGIVGLLTLIVTLLVTSLSVAREREQGTFDQLLVTPFRPIEILLGKSLPGFIIGSIEASVIIFMAVFWFQVPLVGSLATLYTGVFLFLLSAIGVGLMISSLSTTQQQGLLGAFLFLTPAIILSGFATPISNMPEVVQHITLLNPLRYFMVVLRSTFLEGTPFHLLLDQFWPMALIGLVNLTLAGWLFRRRMY